MSILEVFSSDYERRLARYPNKKSGHSTPKPKPGGSTKRSGGSKPKS